MDDATLRERLWLGFARLQTLLGGQAAGGAVLERPGMVASIVPIAPDSPTLNAGIALGRTVDDDVLVELELRFLKAGVRRWGVWVDGGATDVLDAIRRAGLRLTSSSPGMAVALQELRLNGHAPAGPSDLATVGRVNDLAYGNPDGRLERTLAPLPPGSLRAYQADHRGRPVAVALALHHDDDCGVSFVATAPNVRRKGHATHVMHRVLIDAREHGCTTTSLQATELGERLYQALGYRTVSNMQLWEHR
jgi:ribosomal protein S18 acetylase RimI-like enzyme